MATVSFAHTRRIDLIVVMRRILPLLISYLCHLNTASAADRDILVAAVTTNDVSAQVQLVQQLSDSTDPLISQALTAWRQGGVFIYDSPGGGHVPFILNGTTGAAGTAKGVSLLSGQSVTNEAGEALTFTPSALKAVDTTSKLRKVIKTALDIQALVSTNDNFRRDAASKLGQEQNPDYLPYFQNRLKKESKPAVQHALDEAIAITQLVSKEPSVQLAAIKKLGEMKSIPALDLISRIEKDGRTKTGRYDPGVIAAATAAKGIISSHIQFGTFIGTCFRGLSLSAVLLIAAIGLAITFGLMGVINMAHGEMIMIGAYCAYLTQNLFIKWFGQGSRGFDCYFVAALPFSFFAAAAVGVVLERGVIRFLYKRPLESLLATWGVSLVLQQGMRSIFGAANVQVYSPSWLSGNVTWEDVIFAHNRTFVIFFAGAIVLFTWLLLTKTSLGLQVRALMQNRQMAACIGVRTDRINMATFAFGSGLAGMAGACLSQIGNIGPSLGQTHIVDCFMVVVLGGVGSLQGTISAAFGIGVTNQVLEPHLGAVLGKIVVLSSIILFLQWRPAGLFASKGRGLEG